MVYETLVAAPQFGWHHSYARGQKRETCHPRRTPRNVSDGLHGEHKTSETREGWKHRTRCGRLSELTRGLLRYRGFHLVHTRGRGLRVGIRR